VAQNSKIQITVILWRKILEKDYKIHYIEKG